MSPMLVLLRLVRFSPGYFAANTFYATLIYFVLPIPLGLELAAVRVRNLPLSAIVRRLDDQLSLANPAAAGERRHATLASTLDTSHAPSAAMNTTCVAVARTPAFTKSNSWKLFQKITLAAPRNTCTPIAYPWKKRRSD